jgi:hypothetical protein
LVWTNDPDHAYQIIPVNVQVTPAMQTRVYLPVVAR